MMREARWTWRDVAKPIALERCWQSLQATVGDKEGGLRMIVEAMRDQNLIEVRHRVVWTHTAIDGRHEEKIGIDRFATIPVGVRIRSNSRAWILGLEYQDVQLTETDENCTIYTQGFSLRETQIVGLDRVTIVEKHLPERLPGMFEPHLLAERETPYEAYAFAQYAERL